MRPDPLDFDGDHARAGRDPGHASGAIAPCHGAGQLEPLARFIVRRERQRRTIVAEAIAISGVDDQQRPFAGGQRRRIATQPQRRAKERKIRSDDDRLARRRGLGRACVGQRSAREAAANRDRGERAIVRRAAEPRRPSGRRRGSRPARASAPSRRAEWNSIRGSSWCSMLAASYQLCARPTRCARASPARGRVSGPGVIPNAWYQASKLRTMSARYGLGAVRIGQQPLAQVRLAIVAPPHLGPAEIEALVAGRAVDHRRFRPAQRCDDRRRKR